MTLKFIATAANGDDMTAELTAFAASIGLDRVAPGRYSFALVLGLFGGFKSGHQNPAKIMREIEALEGIGPPSQLKPPGRFNHPPLKGLWHKHYLEDGLRATAINAKKGLDRYGSPLFRERMQEAEDAGEVRYMTTQQDIQAVAHDIAFGNFERMATVAELTGEWIVYAQHGGENYYLCLGRHDSGDDYLRSQIDAICCQEFPFLAGILPVIEGQAG
jgi:hypothetical protein